MTICEFDHEMTLDEFSLNVLKFIGSSRYPLSGTIELTPRCSVNCVHCYINEAPGNIDVKSKELTTAQWIEILDQIENAGAFFLMITGGEPLLRPDFDEIFQYTRKKGLIVTLFSNGTLLTKEKALMLSEWNLDQIEISIYGGTKETYEKVTRVPGSYDRCMAGIKNALDAGLRLNLKTIVLKENLHELDLMRSITEEFGLKFRYDGTVWPRLDGSLEPLRHQIPSETLLNLDFTDEKRKSAWNKTQDLAGNSILRDERVFACNASVRSFHIDAFGYLNACMMTRSINYNVLELGFNKAWEEIGKIRKFRRSQPSKCLSCDATAFCSQCPALSHVYYGDFETIVDPICHLAKKRKALFNNTLIDIIE